MEDPSTIGSVNKINKYLDNLWDRKVEAKCGERINTD